MSRRKRNALRGRYELSGTITSVGFASGDRFVVGHWPRSPIGPLADVMWASPDGERRLVASSQRAADFVSAIYTFERVETATLDIDAGDQWLTVHAGKIVLDVRAGRGWRIPVVRPGWFTRYTERRLALRLLGVQTYGVSPTGVREWYRALVYRPVVAARGAVCGHDLGELRPLEPPVRFGFSEPPRHPSMVTVRPLLHDPMGRLKDIVDG